MNDMERIQAEEELRLKNLKFQQEHIHHEHLMLQTVQMKKIAGEVAKEILESGHYCVQGERIKGIEGDIKLIGSDVKTLLERQGEIKDRLDKHITNIYKKNNEQDKDITEIKNTIKMVQWIIGIIATIGAYVGLKRV